MAATFPRGLLCTWHMDDPSPWVPRRKFPECIAPLLRLLLLFPLSGTLFPLPFGRNLLRLTASQKASWSSQCLLPSQDGPLHPKQLGPCGLCLVAWRLGGLSRAWSSLIHLCNPQGLTHSRCQPFSIYFTFANPLLMCNLSIICTYLELLQSKCTQETSTQIKK